MRRKIVLMVSLLIVAGLLTGCAGNDVYSKTFTRTETIKISRHLQNNENVEGSATTAGAALVCLYVAGIPPLAAVCGVAVLLGWARLKDVMGQIDRNMVNKCLRLTISLSPLPTIPAYANFYASPCPKTNIPNSGASAWNKNGVPVGSAGGGLGSGGGGSW
ncbi:MAG: hypothetical protein WCI47_02590 [bacterium]